MATVGKSLLNPHASEYIPISTPPPPPPPPPTVDSPPRENVRPPLLEHPWLNIPPRLINDYVARTKFSPSIKGIRGGEWSRTDGPMKYGVIPISRSHKNVTTIVIKNIPYDYNREMLMQFLDEHCLLENQKARDSNGENIHIFAYDFLYLPMDFKSKMNKGYAFVNFTDERTVWNFFEVFDKLNVFPGSTWAVKIVTAKIQGKEALVNHFKNTRFVCESEEFLPVQFSPPRDGSGESVQMITVGEYKVTPSCSDILKKP
ncbi:protein terminal ear1 homolog [Solanum tuberosum]|nr:PREDICTED: protein terminal ear1 homolog [Solanum tuberosum]